MGQISLPRKQRDWDRDYQPCTIAVINLKTGAQVRELSLMAVRQEHENIKVLAVGQAALAYKGQPGVRVFSPYRHGQIADCDMAIKLLTLLIRRTKPGIFRKPMIYAQLAYPITEVSEAAVIHAAVTAGARKVHVFEEPFPVYLELLRKAGQPEDGLLIGIELQEGDALPVGYGSDWAPSDITVLDLETGKRVEEPPLVALDKSSGTLTAVGRAALEYRDQPNMAVFSPFRYGQIGDFDVASKLLKELVRQVRPQGGLAALHRPDLYYRELEETTQVEERAILDALTWAVRGRDICLFEETPSAFLERTRRDRGIMICVEPRSGGEVDDRGMQNAERSHIRWMINRIGV